MKRHTFKIAGAVFLLAAVLCAPATAQRAEVATANVSGGSLYWNVHVGYDGLELTVSGEDRYVSRTFESGETPSFSLFDAEGQPLPDGTYSWELVVLPKLRELNPEEFENLRSSIDGAEVRHARAPERQVASGAFSVRGGQIVNPDLTEGPDAGSAGQGNVLSTKDFLINDDLIVFGSACIGFDCVNGEVFSFDTIRLKENNLRIKFEDTSGGSFPTRDWEIEINSSANGGQTHFRVNDVDAGRAPFTIEGNSPSHSLYVDSTGRIGFGTSTPVVDLHVKTGDSPTLRLEQDTSSGFGAQVWDVAGNEANFFVRSASTGSQLPFRIRPGAPTSSIDIAANGNVGVGTASPSEALHVRRTSGSSNLHLETTDNAAVHVNMVNSNGEWQLIHGAGGAFNYNRVGVAGNQFVFSPTGTLTIQGSLVAQGGDGTTDPGDTFPDYVFEPGYELMPLDDLRQYVDREQHLPNVLSRRDVRELGGVNVTKLQLQLLEKVEELTLYTLSLHETVEELRADRDAKAEALVGLEEKLAQLEAVSEKR